MFLVAIAILGGCKITGNEIYLWTIKSSADEPLSEFVNAQSEDAQRVAMKKAYDILQSNLIFKDRLQGAIGFYSLYYTPEQAARVWTDPAAFRDMMALSLNMSGVSFKLYCNTVVNCKSEDYEALRQRGEFVKNSLEVTNPALTERIALYLQRFPALSEGPNLNHIHVATMGEIVNDDQKLYRFLTDSDYALDVAIRKYVRELDLLPETIANDSQHFYRQVRPIDPGITAALGS